MEGSGFLVHIHIHFHPSLAPSLLSIPPTENRDVRFLIKVFPGSLFLEDTKIYRDTCTRGFRLPNPDFSQERQRT